MKLKTNLQRMNILSVFVFLLSSSMAYSQFSSGEDNYQPDLYFDQGDFGDRFAVLAESGDVYHYYALDLTKLSSWIEKAYFLNLVYSDGSLISIDSDIDKDQLWIKAPTGLEEKDAICRLEDLKEKAVNEVEAMTEVQRSAWLEKNKKFQEKK